MQRKTIQFATQSVEAGDREAVWSADGFAIISGHQGAVLVPFLGAF
jgi:hypothetical protein